MDERVRFVMAFEDGLYSMTELCEQFGVSRKTGYKWLDRYRDSGLDGLRERSRSPHHCPHRMPESLEQPIVELRRRFPRWGPKKLLQFLRREHPDLDWPAESTVGELLKRRGLSKPRRRRRKLPHPTAPPLRVTAPNQVWTADFKGQFKLGDGRYCYPLTVVDAHSRFVLDCRALPSISCPEAQPVFETLFATYGLPAAIRTDNGIPFTATQGSLRLTQLSVWWLKLGIAHQRIAPGQPQQNGRHERMHRTLKAETTLPPESNMSRQQRRFDRFIEVFNTIRPHQSLDGDVPADYYQPSSRLLPKPIKAPDYPGHFEVRKVSRGGTIKFKGELIFITLALDGEYIGLEEIDAGVWNIMFYQHRLARLNEQTWKIT